MPKQPFGDNVASLRSRWDQPKRRRILNELVNQRSFLDFAGGPDDGIADPTLIRDLRGADLAGRELHDLVLLNADTRWADFSGARVQGAFQYANLGQASFGRAVLTSCNFWKSRLVSCDFGHAALLRVNVADCVLFGTSFRCAQLDDVRFEHLDLRNVDFTDARLGNCVFSGVKLEEGRRGFWETQAQCRLEEVEWCEELAAEPA